MNNPVTVNLDGTLVHEISSGPYREVNTPNWYTYATGRKDGQPEIVDGEIKNSYTVILGGETKEYVFYGSELRRLFRDSNSDELWDMIEHSAAA